MKIQINYIPEDKDLILRLQQNDKAVIKLIYDKYGYALLGVIHKIVGNMEVAEDVLQDAMLRAWKKGQTYDRSKGKLFTWLLNICRNRAIDILRSKNHKKCLLINGNKDFILTNAVSNVYNFNPDVIGLKEELHKLKPIYIEAIQLVYLNGYTHKAAAEKIDVPLGTLKSRVRLGLNKLRVALSEERQMLRSA